jgi:hypothetical protein
MGRSHYKAIEVLLNAVGIADKVTPEEYHNMTYDELHRLFLNAQLLPGAERLIRHLHTHNVSDVRLFTDNILSA